MDPKGANGINRLFKEGDILTKGAHEYAPNKAHAKGGKVKGDKKKVMGTVGEAKAMMAALQKNLNSYFCCSINFNGTQLLERSLAESRATMKHSTHLRTL
jgi:hypothetical protein